MIECPETLPDVKKGFVEGRHCPHCRGVLKLVQDEPFGRLLACQSCFRFHERSWIKMPEKELPLKNVVNQ